MAKCENDVTKFNNFLRIQLDSLKARGESSNNFMVNLFKGYKSIYDGQFKQYMAQKINEYDECSSLTKE